VAAMGDGTDREMDPLEKKGQRDKGTEGH